jgi:hypothetical protein
MQSREELRQEGMIGAKKQNFMRVKNIFFSERGGINIFSDKNIDPVLDGNIHRLKSDKNSSTWPLMAIGNR